MAYVDAYHDRNNDEINVVERIKGERLINVLPAEYVFYYEHPSGSHKSIFGDPCKKVVVNEKKKFNKELFRIAKPIKGKPPKIFEADIDPVFRCLATHYKNTPSPDLHVAFFDIEAGFCESRGFAPPDNPFNEITAITTHQSWTGLLITQVLLPPTLTVEQGQAICEQFENTILYTDERQLLIDFLEIIDDADVLSGWNSEGFDIPYTINRMKRLMNSDLTKKFCLFDQLPKPRKYMKFGREYNTYELIGRAHLDYLLLYQKHNAQKLHSYRLDYVGEIEVGENKVPYEGTLDQLWKEDFDKFIAYSRQDVALLAKIDAKRKYIDLANQVAHANYVTLKTTMGSVNLVDQAIINEMHEMGFVVPCKPQKPGFPGDMDDSEDDDDKPPVVGAYVADPKKGLHDYVGAIDVNSLYPHVLMAMNASPETIIGQFRSTETMELVAERVQQLGEAKRAEAWEGLFHTLEYGHVIEKDDALLTVDFEDGRVVTKTGREWHDWIFDPANHVCVSANGTLFRTDRDGMIPALLKKWYAQRKQLQKAAREYGKIAKEGLTLPDDLAEKLRQRARV